MGSAYRLHRRTCYTKKEPPRRISEVLKVAATYSPTVFRSAVPSAMLSLCPVPPLCCPRLSPPRCLPPLPAPLLSALSPAPARRRRAQPTPHTVRHRRHRARLRSRLDYSRTPIIPPDYIKSMVSLSIRCSLRSRSLSIYRAFLIRCASHGCIYVLRTVVFLLVSLRSIYYKVYTRAPSRVCAIGKRLLMNRLLYIGVKNSTEYTE